MTSPLAVGIDVGGTKIAAGLVDDAGTIVRRHVTTAHAERPPAEVIAAIEESCAALMEQAPGTGSSESAWASPATSTRSGARSW